MPYINFLQDTKNFHPFISAGMQNLLLNLPGLFWTRSRSYQ